MQHRFRTKRNKKKLIAAVLALNLLLPQESLKALQLIDAYCSTGNPDDVDLLRLKGNILDIRLKYEQSIPLYKRILRVDRSNTLALIDLGDAYSNQGKYQASIKYYDRALTLIRKGQHTSGMYVYSEKGEEYITACDGKAESLLELNRPMAALKCVVEGLQKYPSDIILGATLEKAQERYGVLQQRQFKKRKRNLRRKLKTQKRDGWVRDGVIA